MSSVIHRQGQVGFLQTSNRANVALSRARHGMYILGSTDTLHSSKKAGFWHEVGASLVSLFAARDFTKRPYLQAMRLRAQVWSRPNQSKRLLSHLACAGADNSGDGLQSGASAAPQVPAAPRGSHS